MKIKRPFEWKVLYEHFNRKEIMFMNVFEHGGFKAELLELLSEHKNKSDFEIALRDVLRYYFWSKCEYEVVVSCWPPNEKGPRVKIDVYEQLMSNYYVFIDYIWQHKDNIIVENGRLYYES